MSTFQKLVLRLLVNILRKQRAALKGEGIYQTSDYALLEEVNAALAYG